MYHPFLSRRGLRAKAKTAWARITLNRYTTTFFVFSFLYCLVQGLVQSFLFSIDLQYSSLAQGIVSGGDIPFRNITYLDGTRHHLVLHMCDDIPHGQSPDPCFVIFNSTAPAPQLLTPLRSLSDWENGLRVDPIADPANATAVIGVNITMPSAPNTPLFFDNTCLQTLVYPSAILTNFKREDIAWICLQFWLLAISFLAILNDSVPHILAVLATRAISTAWATYAIWRGPTFAANFAEIFSSPQSPCALDFFPEFFAKRQQFEIADLFLSSTGLIFFLYLSWTLLQIYSAQSFKCVGAPEHVMRYHKFLMALLACLQLEAFVLPAGMGLWINVLTNTAIKEISLHSGAYQAVYITSVILLIPWIAMGWYAIRLEMHRMMLVFLGIGFIIITGWALMFYSLVFPWTFMQWPYLGCFTIASFVLLGASIIIGIVCRMNFGKGLKEYLHAESTLSALNFAPDEFTHRTSQSHLTKSKSLSSSSMRKSSFDFSDSNEKGPTQLSSDDILNSAPMFFVSSLGSDADPDADMVRGVGKGARGSAGWPRRGLDGDVDVERVGGMGMGQGEKRGPVPF
ncbi:hypothetical protein BDN70DRAFT_868024 [Pholiota conissans]|uniref:Uncharacterized protein n=1 Tax=Pholiota conissans TaxID=109636 RepID=A0A9P5YSF1_9AGAR|nr:hypothetical protein BDN70DRAFT_868024 [Pholiota conissans]